MTNDNDLIDTLNFVSNLMAENKRLKEEIEILKRKIKELTNE